VTGKTIPVLAWNAGYAPSTLRIIAPEKYGGFGDVKTKAKVEAEATGRNVEEIIDKVCCLCSSHFTSHLPVWFRCITHQKETWLLFLECLLCTTMKGSLRRYDHQASITLVLMMIAHYPLVHTWIPAKSNVFGSVFVRGALDSWSNRHLLVSTNHLP
jgi:hypothetical protein